MSPFTEMRIRLLRWWGWLLLLTLGLLLLVSVRYFAVIDLDVRPASLLFRASMLVAHFATIAAFSLLPVLLVVIVWPRIAIPLGVLCGSAAVALVLIDTHVYQLYRFHINAGS